MKNNTRSGWKEFIHLVTKSKLPWTLYIIGVVTAFISTTISLGLPKVTQKIYEGKIFDNGLIMQYVWLSVGGVVLSSIAAYFAYITSPITRRNIQWGIWPRIIRMPMGKYDRYNPLNLISRVTIDPKFVNESIADFRTVLTATYSLVGSFIIMYNMSVPLTLALLPVVPYILIVSAIVGHFTQKTQYGVQDKLSVMTGFFAERLPKIRLIKTFGKEQEEMERGNAAIKQQYEADKKRAIVDLFAEPLMQSIQAIVVGTVLIYGSFLVKQGEMKISEIIAFYLYVQFIHNNVLKYGIFWQSLKQAMGASMNIANIKNTEEERVQRERTFAEVVDQTSGEISLENVSFSYGEKNVLKDVSFAIPEGKVTAIVGPSGGGKTTLFTLLERMYEPNVGKIMIGGIPAEEVNLDEWRQAIAYVSQSSPLLSGTIRDNITYGVKTPVTDEEVRQAASDAAALDFIDSFPNGLDTDVGEYGSKLSGGQRQRIAIARAFIMNPAYLLLDEATSNLDAKSEHDINVALGKLMKGRTTILISHDLKDMANMDQIAVVEKGRISGVGSHDELLEQNELYQDLIELQREKAIMLASN